MRASEIKKFNILNLLRGSHLLNIVLFISINSKTLKANKFSYRYYFYSYNEFYYTKMTSKGIRNRRYIYLKKDQ